MMPKEDAEVILAHHWLIQTRGGEHVFREIAAFFPYSPIYTLLANRKQLDESLQKRLLITSSLQYLPQANLYYKKLLPLYPRLIASIKVPKSTKLLISSDASFIKGLTLDSGTKHICYCHSPPRYIWDLKTEYLESAEMGSSLERHLFLKVLPLLREFDHQAAQSVTQFVANSEFVRDRIMKCYQKQSEVVYPFVDLANFYCSESRPKNYFLVVSQLTRYKRIDLAISACKKLKIRLIIIGEGPEGRRLRRLAGSETRFLGHQPLSLIRDYYQNCQALIFPGIEDFGITPLEAQACGRPVIAFGLGGALETILDNITGLFFYEQTAEALVEILEKFIKNADQFNPVKTRNQAERFSQIRFKAELCSVLSKVAPEHRPSLSR